MKPFPASLAILLSLCRSSSADWLSWVDVGIPQTNQITPYLSDDENVFPIDSQTFSSEYDKIVVANLTTWNTLALFQNYGNTIYALALHRLGMYVKLPAYYRKALDNGILCEVSFTPRSDKIKLIQYEADQLTEEQRAIEVEAAKQLTIGIDCTNNTRQGDATWSCFCDSTKNVLLYCLAATLRLKVSGTAGVAKKTCELEVMEGLMPDPTNSSSATVLEFFWDPNCYINFVRFFDDPLAEWTWGGKNYTAQRYCSFADPASLAPARALFASNALHWTLDGYTMQAVFNGTKKDLDSACAVENFASSDIGKCACNKDVGTSFCVQKLRAEYYKKIGYLNCTDGARKFEGSNKPATLPPFACHSDSVAAATSPECAEYRKAWK